MEVNQTMPSLVNGVSQQPVELRHDTQVNEMVNCLPSFVKGVTRRNPLQLVATENLIGDYPFIHTYERGDDVESYIIVVEDGSWKTYNLAGVLQDSGTDTYLDIPSGEKPIDSFSAVTVGDTTFIINKHKTVSESGSFTHNTSDQNLHRQYGHYWVKRTYVSFGGSNANTPNTYTYTIEGFKWPETTSTTKEGADSQLVAQNLASGVSGQHSGSFVRKYIGDSGTWTTSDSWGNQASTGWHGLIKKLQDLPNDFPEAWGGRSSLIKVTNDENNAFEGFWAYYTGSAWQETVAPGISTGMDANTMPHVLRRVAVGDFTFEPFEWYERTAGDEHTNAMPSFIGKTISDIFFFGNRLGVLSGSNLVLSESGVYENFFRTTVTDLLDTDPIDVAVDTNSVVNLRYAVPHNKNLLLFSDNEQFILSSDDTLTPKKASVKASTAYKFNNKVQPVSIGPNTYFASTVGDNTKIREYFNVPNTTSNDAQAITEHVPSYIPGDIVKLDASTKHDMLFVLCESTPNTIYVYNMAWEGEQKSQSSWHKWVFNKDIFSINVVDNNLLVMCTDIGGTVKELHSVYISVDQQPNLIDNGTNTYESYVELNEWGFRTGGDNKVDNKEGRLQIRSVELQTSDESHQKITSTVGNSVREVVGKKATILGETKRTSIKISSVGNEPMGIHSLTLKGRFTSKSKTV
jgi:hypothetical protein